MATEIVWPEVPKKERRIEVFSVIMSYILPQGGLLNENMMKYAHSCPFITILVGGLDHCLFSHIYWVSNHPN